ncbi:hypothetical protein JOE11_001832 [Robbsia andropogonis]
MIFVKERHKLPASSRTTILLPSHIRWRQLSEHGLSLRNDRDRGCGVSETLETEHHVRSRLDVSMGLLNHILFRYFEDRTFMSSSSRPSAFISRTARCDAG